MFAFGLGERSGSAWMLARAVLMVLGIVLHLAESHGHKHVHDAMEHEHAHRHDDAHHTHHHHAVMPSCQARTVTCAVQHAHPHVP